MLAKQGGSVANVTLALDDALLRKARVKAVHENTSVNAVIRGFLTRWVDDEGERAAAVERLRAALDASVYDSGGASWTRAELHER
jgi:plasmid stability protein